MLPTPTRQPNAGAKIDGKSTSVAPNPIYAPKVSAYLISTNAIRCHDQAVNWFRSQTVREAESESPLRLTAAGRTEINWAPNSDQDG